MEELVNLVAQKANISPDQAKQAVQVVLGYLKDKLPAPVASQVDGLLAGGGSGASVSDVSKSLGGLFGQK
jgi:uncharacterized protein (DUF2267 family)